MREWAIFGAAVVLVLVFLAWATRSDDGSLNLSLLVLILVPTLIAALFALGLNLQFGFTGLLNFGHVGTMLIGAYAAAIFASVPADLPPTLTRGAWPDWLHTGSPLLAVLIGILAAAAFGLLVGIPTLRLREDYLAILTISAAEILRTFAFNEEPYTGGTRGLQRIPLFAEDWVAGQGWLAGAAEVLELRNPYTLFLLLLVLLVIAAVFVVYEVLTRSPYGRVLRAIRDDEDAASALGKNVFRFKLQAVFLGSVVGAIAGACLAWHLRSLQASPDLFGPVVTFNAYIAMVLGGAGSNRGVVAGTLLLHGLVFEGTRYVDVYSSMGFGSAEGSAFRILLIGMLLIGMVMLRPEGLLGRKEEMVFGK